MTDKILELTEQRYRVLFRPGTRKDQVILSLAKGYNLSEFSFSKKTLTDNPDHCFSKVKREYEKHFK